MSGKMNVRVDGQELVLERIFAAPNELVFEAFSTAEHLTQWWGPRGWELTVCNIDFLPGGIWHYCMKCTDQRQGDTYGQESWGKALYDLIDQPDQIVYTDYFSDADGNIAEDMPASRIETLFLPHEGKTKLVSRAYFDSEDSLRQGLDQGLEQGITETWDRLEEYLARLQS